jgi:hypothetical protein
MSDKKRLITMKLDNIFPKEDLETTLLNIQGFVCREADKGKLTALILLDMSSAFYLVDHPILIADSALTWFRSYLHARERCVMVNGVRCSSRGFTCGVPQGSVLGLVLFTIYMRPLAHIIGKHAGIKFKLYAEHIQIYISFCPSDAPKAIEALENCFNDVKIWLLKNMLLLNTDKTELLLLGTRQHLTKCQDSSVVLDQIRITA